MRNVLFVDDEAMLLKLYEVFFGSKKEEWKAYICSDPQDVNNIIRSNPIDIIVSDYNMSNMNGAEVLKQVVEKFPWVVRIIITASYDEAARLKSINYAHRCIIKPVKLKDLESEIENAYMIFKSDISRIVRTKITGIDTLPVFPKLYNELVKEIKKEDEASLSKISKMISSDPNMSVNILKFVNSPFFSKSEKIFKAEHAVKLLGTNIIKNLVLSAEILKIFPMTKDNEAFVDEVVQHSTLCSKLMKLIFQFEYKNGNIKQKDIDLAETIGMLHDIGKIILSSLYPSIYKDINEIRYTTEQHFSDLEKHIIGVSHAEVAAYLLSLWGLPSKISEIIAEHSKLSENYQAPNLLLRAIHFVNFITDHIDTQNEKELLHTEFVKNNIDWYNVIKNDLNPLPQ